MAKYWIDPDSGWRWGFPKVWDPEEESNLKAWLLKEGHPDPDSVLSIRSWEYVPEMNDDSSST